MEFILIAAIPLLALILFGRKLAPQYTRGLQILSLPFFVIVAFYSLILALAFIMCFAIIGFIMYKFQPKSKEPTVIRVEHYRDLD